MPRFAGSARQPEKRTPKKQTQLCSRMETGSWRAVSGSFPVFLNRHFPNEGGLQVEPAPENILPESRKIMPKMRAVQVPNAKGPFQLVEREIPEPGAGAVRIKVQACGICHSDEYAKEGSRERQGRVREKTWRASLPR